MTTITEDYVSFEIAKLLKDKGFDQNCATYYLDGQVWRHYHGEVIPKGKQIYAAPTQAIAIKWLREVHNIFIDICTLSPLAYTYRVCLISDTTGCLYEDYACEEGERFMSYEEAVEFALDYCLNNIL